MTKKIGLLIITIFIFGCTPAKNSFVEPKKTNNIATIIGDDTDYGVFNWEVYGILSIDNKFVDYGLFSDNFNTKVNIPQGNHSIVALGKFNKGVMGTGPFYATSNIDFKANPGKNYKLKGSLDGKSMKFWIIDTQTKKIVSKKINAPYHIQPQTTYMYVPVY